MKSRKTACAKRRKTKIRSKRVRRNRAHPLGRLSKEAAYSRIMKTGLKGLPENIRKLAKTPAGRAQLRLFANFHRVGKVPSIRMFPSGLKKTVLAVGLGYAPKMELANYPRGKRGKRISVTGMWHAFTRAKGKKAVGKTIFFMSDRKKLNGKMRFVGYAPVCWYIPYKDVEDQGSNKAGATWKHHFSDDGGRWPEVYADTERLGKNTNFVVTNGTFTVTDWIRR